MPYAKVGEVNLYYEVHGEGEPFMFIAGTGSSCEYMKVVTVDWFSKHFQLIIFDHRGTGRSDKPDLPYSTRMFASDAVGLLEHLGIPRAHVGGRSMGGRVSQWVAIDHPYRVGALVLSSTGAGSWSNYQTSFVPERGVPYPTALRMIELGFEKYMQEHRESDFMFTAGFVKERPDVVQKFHEYSSRYPTPLNTYLRHVVARQRHETRDLLDRIQAPTLVIDGIDDTGGAGTGNHVESARDLARLIPGAELTLVPGAHNYLMEHPENHQVIIDFLKRHPIKG
jgi:pimeloyl-ACP methyl ester carboxylesterase